MKVRARYVLGLTAFVFFSDCLVFAQEKSPTTDDSLGVTIEGSRVLGRTPSRENTAATTVIGKDRLQSPGLTGAEVLRTVPGVFVTDAGAAGGVSTASIRGATAAQTPIYLGGVRINDDVGGTADISTIPLWLVDRIEIYRGHAPIQADRLGIGGAIFLDPQVPTTKIGLGGQLGSFGNRAAWLFGGVADHQMGILVGMRQEHSDNDYSFTNDNGTAFNPTDDRKESRKNADSTTSDIWMLGRQKIGEGTQIRLLVNHTERDQGVPGLALTPSIAARVNQRREIAAVTAVSECAKNNSCEIESTTSALFSHSNYSDPEQELHLGSSTAHYDGQRVEQSLMARVLISPTFTLAPVFRLAHESLQISGPTELRALREFARMGSSFRWQLTPLWSVHGLFTGECNGTSKATASSCDQPIAPMHVGVQMGQTNRRVVLNIGRYARIPTLGELYGISSSTRGRDTLEPERGITADLGITNSAITKIGPLYAEIFLFSQWVENLVSYERSSLGYFRPYNVGSTRTIGAEATTRYSPAQWLLFEVTATAVDPRDTTQGRRLANDILPFRSRLSAIPRVEVKHRWANRWFYETRAEVRYVYQSNRFVDPAGLVTIPSQGSLDIELASSTLSGHATFRARVQNMLDQSRFDAIGYPLPGRMIFGSMEATFP